MAKRPLTQREIKKSKKAARSDEMVIIINKDKQMVPIQLRAPGGYTFWQGEQTIPLLPKRMSKFPKNRLYQEQIINLQKAGRIQVLDAS
jgi:hypothetical protein